jgi:vitamin B12 transporter
MRHAPASKLDGRRFVCRAGSRIFLRANSRFCSRSLKATRNEEIAQHLQGACPTLRTHGHEVIPAVLLVLLALGPTPTPSPTPSPAPLPVIGTVKVATGSREAMHRLPIPASLMDARAIANQPAITGDAVLSGLAGFDRDRSNSMFTNYGQLRVSFAGAGNDRGLVLVDGIPAQDGFGGQVDWAAYPAPDLVRAELLRGPGSALYGGGAIGGVLSLQTFGPTAATREPQGTISFAGGTHGFAQDFANAQTALSSKLSASVSALSQQLQYDDLPPAYQSAHDRLAQAQDSMASLRLRYAPSSQLVLDYGYRGAWDYQQEGRSNYDFWRRLVQNAVGIAHASTHATLRGTFYERDGFVTNRADKFPSAPGTLLYTQYVPTHESGVLADWIVEGGSSTFNVHADAKFVGGLSDQYNGIGAFTTAGSGTQDLAGLAIQETLRWSRGELVGGVRGDTIDLVRAQTQKGSAVTGIAPRTDRALSPRLAARYDLTRNVALRASAGGGFRAPYLNELVRGYQIGSIAYLPNASLVRERSSSFTGGFDWTFARSELSVDYVHTAVSDAIDFCTVSATVQQRCNFSHTATDATTLVYVQNVGTCSRLSVSGNEQDARITQGTPAEIGKQLPYVPKGSASASFDTSIGTVQAGADVSYLGTTYADDLNLQPLGSAVTAGLHAAVPLAGGASAVLDVENLTGAHYLSSIDRYGPPQVVSLSLRAPLGRASQPSCSR